jgi:hypothetical protein
MDEPRVTRIRRATKLPRYADPWSFRDHPSLSSAAADLNGQPTQVRFYRRGGVLACTAPPNELVPSPVPDSPCPPQRSSLTTLRRRKAATFARYRQAGWCTAVELSTIDALWFEGVTLRQLAKREGVSPAAISDRIVRLSHKAQEFSNWWRLKNHTRQRLPVNSQ